MLARHNWMVLKVSKYSVCSCVGLRVSNEVIVSSISVEKVKRDIA